MKTQWSQVIFPGLRVSVRDKDEVIPCIVQDCSYVSKMSSDCWCFYTTARALVKLSSMGGDVTREYQFRDLILK